MASKERRPSVAFTPDVQFMEEDETPEEEEWSYDHARLLYLVSLYARGARTPDENEGWIRQVPLLVMMFEAICAEALDFDNESFDGVIGTAVLHHLDVVCAYCEMSRVLCDGGRAVFIEPLGHNPLINAYRRRTPENRTEFEHPLRCEDFTLAQRYFDGVHVEMYHLLAIITSPFASRPWGKLLHSALSWVDRRLLALNERMRWQAWIAVAELRKG